MTTRRSAISVLLVVIAALAGLGGCSSSSADGSANSQSRFVAGDGTAILLPEGERAPAPNITGTTLDDKAFSLAALKGKVVALNVWASWCAPCRAEAPALDQVARDTASQGVQFIGLDTRDTKAAADAFVRRFEVSYPSVWDPDGQLQLQFRGTLPPQAIPSTLLVDRQGRVAGRILGKVDRAQLRELLTRLANEPSSA